MRAGNGVDAVRFTGGGFVPHRAWPDQRLLGRRKVLRIIQRQSLQRKIGFVSQKHFFSGAKLQGEPGSFPMLGSLRLAFLLFFFFAN
jgi:hypothetical protein